MNINLIILPITFAPLEPAVNEEATWLPSITSAAL
jgi:hypothetical protein